MRRHYFDLPALVLVPLLCGCASKGKIVTTERVPIISPNTSGTLLTPADQSLVRSGEVIKSYQVNPYEDPHDPSVRHREHLVERVESSPRWINSPTHLAELNSGPASAPPDPAKVSNPYTAELEIKLKQQESVMLASTKLADVMESRIKELTTQLDKNKDLQNASSEVLSKNQQLHSEISSLRGEVASLEAQMRVIADSAQKAVEAPQANTTSQQPQIAPAPAPSSGNWTSKAASLWGKFQQKEK